MHLLHAAAVSGVVISAYIAVCIFLLVAQNRLIFFPTQEITATPAKVELDYEDIWLPVADSTSQNTEERIHGWWLPAARQQQGRVLLYLHGNSENISGNIHHANRFHKLGFSVFLIDYRGYGSSEGSFPTEESVYQDAETAWNYLVEQRGIPPEQIVIYGHSLGGAVAIELADRQPRAAGLIVEGSFTSIRDMTTYRYPWFVIFPIDQLLTHHFDSISKVSQLKMPVLFIHGTADETVPYPMSQTLFAAAPEPKQLFTVPGAGHENLAKLSGETYLQTIRNFMELVENNLAQMPTRSH
ncbi:MAG TPA: alpha/beta fold hydrolase [Oscillatoriaceae cyanobacterium M33_DOE_052]|uniref:Alpha/beta fold hydrolase n=1 Tax=Planktothricoides sp. SpSt-374 TaxID=2282167 RepID=A0A7C3ZVT8_9CYAN|nr:alpha/beta fold hydrolase [Oscillatoriaceae cyanobacterium M33_DOE_052]